jgi:hypothetical protein
MIDTTTPAGAIFSECRNYRYVLWRRWNSNLPMILFICLNPSKANEYQNDNTIRRLISFSRKWNYGGFYICNLFALCSTDPKEIKKSIQPIEALGDSNDSHIKKFGELSDEIVFAWGNDGKIHNRSQEIIKIFPKAYCFTKTMSGQPRHPLYVSGDQPLRKFTL